MNLLEEKISALENKAINDKEEMTRVHEQNLVDLRVQLIQEGQELSDRNVGFLYLFLEFILLIHLL